MDFDLFKSDWPIIRVTDNPIHQFITPEPDGGHYSLCREQQSCQVVHDLFVLLTSLQHLGHITMLSMMKRHHIAMW